MKGKEIQALLERSGLPVTWRAWPEGAAPPLPWLCYLLPSVHTAYADGTVLVSFERVRVELYARRPDEAAEQQVEAALAAAGLAWAKEREYLTDEQCSMTIYEIEV